MKENVKIFLIALILGMAVAFFLSYKFQDDVAFALNPKVTYFYVGTYNNLDVANEKKLQYTNSFIFENNGIYQVVIGVYQDKSVIDLMSSYQKFPAAPAAVYVNVEKVVLVELHFDPSAAVGYHSKGVENLIGTVYGFFKAYPGAPMQLAYDNTLGAVYDKAATGGHHVDVAHKNALFLSAVALAQAKSDVEGYGICRAFPYALNLAHLRPHQFVGDVFELVLAVVALYGEYLAENRVQTLHFPLGRRNVLLQEIGVRLDLVLNEIRKGQYFLQLSKIFSL